MYRNTYQPSELSGPLPLTAASPSCQPSLPACIKFWIQAQTPTSTHLPVPSASLSLCLSINPLTLTCSVSGMLFGSSLKLDSFYYVVTFRSAPPGFSSVCESHTNILYQNYKQQVSNILCATHSIKWHSWRAQLPDQIGRP